MSRIANALLITTVLIILCTCTLTGLLAYGPAKQADREVALKELELEISENQKHEAEFKSVEAEANAKPLEAREDWEGQQDVIMSNALADALRETISALVFLSTHEERRQQVLQSFALLAALLLLIAACVVVILLFRSRLSPISRPTRRPAPHSPKPLASQAAHDPVELE